MEDVILFFITFVFMFIFYQIFIIGPAKRRKNTNNKKQKNKELMEIKYLESRYNLDLKKIKYEQLLQMCALVSSFDISIAVSVVSLFDNFFLELLCGFLSAIILIIISYHFVYMFYKKKGMIKDGDK